MSFSLWIQLALNIWFIAANVIFARLWCFVANRYDYVIFLFGFYESGHINYRTSVFRQGLHFLHILHCHHGYAGTIDPPLLCYTLYFCHIKLLLDFMKKKINKEIWYQTIEIFDI